MRKDLFKGVLVGALAVLVIGGGTLGAMAAIGDGGVVTTCFNKSLGTWKPINTSLGKTCPTGTQTIVFYTKGQVDSLISSVTPTHHTLTLYEDTLNCTQAVNGSGPAAVFYFQCSDYDNAGFTGSAVGTEISSYVGPCPQTATVAFHLADGDIQATGMYNCGLSHLTVTGGTGAYVGATGTVDGDFYNNFNGFQWSFDYTLPA